MQDVDRRARILVVYYSYSGNTRRIASALSERLRKLCDVETVEIVPTRRRSYLHWLAYSFLPNSEVKIENPPIEMSAYDAVLLGFPKWTLSCPPLNRFIRQIRGVTAPKFFLFMTCGGFDDQRYLRNMVRKLTSMHCNIIESLTVKRKQIQGETYSLLLDSFLRRVEEQSTPFMCV